MLILLWFWMEIILRNYSTNPDPLSIPHQTRLNYSSDYFRKFVQTLISLFLILVLVVLCIDRIVFDCYTYGFENNNLRRIRVSFLLNIPFALGILIYIIVMFRERKMPSFLHISKLVNWSRFELHWRMQQLVVNFLSCSTRYYQQVYMIRVVVLFSYTFFYCY
jgi:hypothetical protein